MSMFIASSNIIFAAFLIVAVLVVLHARGS